MGFDVRRVIEVLAVSSAGSGRVGSGYRVTETAVLTAGHVVAGLPVGSPAADDGTSRCEVRPLGMRDWMRGSVLWHDDTADVAVIGLPPGAPPLPTGSAMPQWGVVAGAEPVSCMAVGFPWAQERPDGTRDTEHLIGFVAPFGTAKTGQLSLNVLSAPPSARAQGLSWAGMSGAAVFAGPT